MAHEPQDVFVQRRRPRWDELDVLVKGKLAQRSGEEISRLASLYRMVCTDLMRARSAGYTHDLESYLDRLVSHGHDVLYGSRATRLPSFLRGLWGGFPRALRRNGAFFAASTLLFTLPLLVGVAGALTSDDFATSVLPPSQLQAMADAYSTGFEGGRATGADTGMAGFYIYNNIGIAFRCFAMGILFGLGSVFFLVYNGLIIGTTTGYVSAVGFGGNILTFMCGHAPFELTAILISGAAGLRMGWALVATEGLTRVGSLRKQAPDLGRLVLGAAGMLLVAAFVEGFWSPSSAPPPVKWGVSGVGTVLVAAYLAFGGRSEERRA